MREFSSHCYRAFWVWMRFPFPGKRRRRDGGNLLNEAFHPATDWTPLEAPAPRPEPEPKSAVTSEDNQRPSAQFSTGTGLARLAKPKQTRLSSISWDPCVSTLKKGSSRLGTVESISSCLLLVSIYRASALVPHTSSPHSTTRRLCDKRASH